MLNYPLFKFFFFCFFFSPLKRFIHVVHPSTFMRTCALSDDLSPFFGIPPLPKRYTGVHWPGLYSSYFTVSLASSVTPVSYAVSYCFHFLLTLCVCVLGPTAFISCFSIRSSIIRWQHQTLIILVNSFQTCVYPEASNLPDDVARRTLFFFFFFFFLVVFVDSFDVSRTTISLCFNDTPARACKQLAEPERRTFLPLSLPSSRRTPVFLPCLFSSFTFRVLVLYFTQTSKMRVLASHVLSTPTREAFLFFLFSFVSSTKEQTARRHSIIL